MAQIRLLDSGKWQAVIRRKKFPNQSQSFKFKKDAEIWATHVESKMHSGDFNDISQAEEMTISAGLKKYLEEITPTKKGSYQDSNRIKRLMKNKKISNKSLATLKPFDCESYKNEMVERGLSGSTINKELSVISHLYEVANKKWGIHCVNPVKLIEKPKVDNARERRLSELEEYYLIRALSMRSAGDRTNTVVVDIVRFAIETGMRKSEPFQLNWQQVDLKGQVAHLKITKNGKPRAVPLSTAATKILKGLDGGESKDKVEGQEEKVRRGKVFKTTYSALTQSFRRAVGRAIRLYKKEIAEDMRIEDFLEDFTYHDLRHEATSRMADKLQMHELMKVTGHQDTRMLARYYHPKPEDLAKKLG